MTARTCLCRNIPHVTKKYCGNKVVNAEDNRNVNPQDATFVISPNKQDDDPYDFSGKRAMTTFQEKINAFTILLSPLCCLCAIMSGNWISDATLGLVGMERDASFCISCNGLFAIDRFFFLKNLLPLPMLVVLVGAILHAPFSFCYHWCCATCLAPGHERIDHVSRRLDNILIHVCSAMWSYGTSGSLCYTLFCTIYNLDCAWRHCEKKIIPERNQRRITIAIVFYITPALFTGSQHIFPKVFAIICVSLWLFVTYPIGGYSHAAFHVVISLLPYYMLLIASNLRISEEQMQRKALDLLEYKVFS